MDIKKSNLQLIKEFIIDLKKLYGVEICKKFIESLYKREDK
jgi:hypothetical protein